MPLDITTKSFSIEPGVYLRSMWSRKLLPYAMSFGVLAVGLTLILAGAGICSLTSGLTFGGGLLLLQIVSTYVQSRRNIYRGSGPGAFAARTVRFSDNEICVSSPSGGESKLPWKAVENAERRGPFVILFTSRLNGVIVADYAFHSSQDREKVYAFIEKSVKRRGLAPLRRRTYDEHDPFGAANQAASHSCPPEPPPATAPSDERPIVTRSFAIDRPAYLRAVWAAKLPGALILVTVVMAAADVIVNSRPQEAEQIASAALGFLVGWPVALALITVIVYFSARQSVLYNSGASAWVGRTISFNSVGMEVRTDSGIEMKCGWDTVIYAKRRREFIMFYLTSQGAISVTDEAFVSMWDRREAYDIIAKSVKWKGRVPLRRYDSPE